MAAAPKLEREALEQLAKDNFLELLKRWFSGAEFDGKKVSKDGWVIDVSYGSWNGPEGQRGTSVLDLRAKQKGISILQVERLVQSDLEDIGAIKHDQPASTAPKKKKGPKAIVPVPDDAVKLDWTTLLKDELSWRRFGAKQPPSAFWEYRDEKNRLIGYRVRFDPPGEAKYLGSLIWAGSGKGWQMSDFPMPYPIYGLQELVKFPDKPVLIVEGEKTCNAAIKLFPGHVVVSWPNGVKAIRWVEWGWLKGRTVIIWPDADPEGDVCSSELRTILYRNKVHTCRVVELPPGLTLGWDLADPIPDDMDPQLLVDRAMDIPKEIAELNRKHMVLKEQGAVVVYTEELDPLTGNRIYVRSTFQDLRNLYCNRFVILGVTARGATLEKDLGTYWLESPDRREYQGVVFSPSKTPDGYLNLWQGFTVTPKPGSWDLLREHILQNICNGDQKNFDYVISWLARMVQHPDEAGRVALVMRGKRGTGKGVFAQAVGHLLGEHFLHLSNSRHLTGHFNLHLRTSVFVFADEAFWAGDKQGESTLKTLVTEDWAQFEGKGRDTIKGKNTVHLAIASNENWVVPAGLDERRFLVVDVSDSHIQDFTYFRSINAQLKAGGYEALLYDLLNHDIEDFDVFDVPKTEALLEQKIRSLDAGLAWWLDVLQEGKLPGDENGEGRVPFQLLVDSYVKHINRNSYSARGAATKLAMDLRKWLDKTPLPRRPFRDKYKELVGYNTDGSPRLTEKQGSIYMMPELKACRAAFERLTNQSFKWDNDGGSWERETWSTSVPHGADRNGVPEEDIPF